jgi:hypothetical protein
MSANDAAFLELLALDTARALAESHRRGERPSAHAIEQTLTRIERHEADLAGTAGEGGAVQGDVSDALSGFRNEQPRDREASMTDHRDWATDLGKQIAKRADEARKEAEDAAQKKAQFEALANPFWERFVKEADAVVHQIRESGGDGITLKLTLRTKNKDVGGSCRATARGSGFSFTRTRALSTWRSNELTGRRPKALLVSSWWNQVVSYRLDTGREKHKRRSCWRTKYFEIFWNANCPDPVALATRHCCRLYLDEALRSVAQRHGPCSPT